MTQTSTDSAVLPELVISDEGVLLAELAEIRSLIQADVQHRQDEVKKTSKTGHKRLWSTVGFWCVVGVLTGVTLLLLSVRLNNILVLRIGAVLFLGSPLLWILVTVRNTWLEWKEHKLASIKQANASAKQQEALVRELMRFQRSSLSYAADELTNREARVSRRVSSYLGASRAGGIVGVVLP